MYSFLCDLTFLIETIISEDIFLREDLSVAKILHSRIDGERKRLLRFRFFYGKHFHRNFYRYVMLCVAIGLLMLMIYGRFRLVPIANVAIVIISAGLIFYWQFATEIIQKLNAFRLNFEVHNLIRSVREHGRCTRNILKFNQNYENILNQNNLQANDESSAFQFILESWQRIADVVRSEQMSVTKELLRNIQYLVKYAKVSEEFELCFLNHMQTIIIENLLLSELCDLFLLLQSNFFLVLVLSLCNRVNLQSDSTLKQLVVNLNCLIRDSNRKLKSDYENMKLLAESELGPNSKQLSITTGTTALSSKTNKCSIVLVNVIEWLTKFTPKVIERISIGRRRRQETINFEEIKFRKLIFDLIVKFKVTHSVLLNIDQISKQMVNENTKGESIDSKNYQIEKNLTLLNNLFSECKNLIALLNANYLKSSKRKEIVRDEANDDNKLQHRDNDNENEIPEAKENNPVEDQVFEFTPQRPVQTETCNRSLIVSQTQVPENVQFLNELKQVLKSRESDWNQREQIALEKNNAAETFRPAADQEAETETKEENPFDCNKTDNDEFEEIANMIAVNTAWSNLLMSAQPPPMPDHEIFTANDDDADS